MVASFDIAFMATIPTLVITVGGKRFATGGADEVVEGF